MSELPSTPEAEKRSPLRDLIDWAKRLRDQPRTGRMMIDQDTQELVKGGVESVGPITSLDEKP